MKRKTLWVVGCVALLCAIGLGISAQTKASDRELWEYHSMLGMPGQGIINNRLGSEGWELVAITGTDNPNQCWYYFKREK